MLVAGDYLGVAKEGAWQNALSEEAGQNLARKEVCPVKRMLNKADQM